MGHRLNCQSIAFNKDAGLTCSKGFHGHGGIGHGVRISCLQVLWLPPWPVLVVRVVGHVLGADPLGLVDERSLVRLGEQLPLGAEPLRDLRVVHLRVVLRYLAPLHPRPHHERVHRTLDVLAFACFRLLLLVCKRNF